MATTSNFNLNIGTTLDTSGATKAFQAWQKQFVLTKKVEIGATFNGQQAIKQVNTFKNAMGDTVEVIKHYDMNMGKLRDANGKFMSNTSQVVVKTKQVTQNAQQASNSLNNMGNSAQNASSGMSTLTARIQRFAQYFVMSKVIQTFTKALNDSIQIIKEYDTALTEMKKVTDLSANSIDEYSQRLGKIGAEVGRTTTEMVEASTNFQRAGFSAEQSAELAKIAVMYQNVSDAEISAGDSASFLISQMKAFGEVAENPQHIIDGVNEVAANFAVSTDGLVTALEKSGSALGNVGNSYDQTIALVTGANEILQGQSSKVGLGLRTISINLAKLSAEAKSTTTTVEGVTFAVKDENGEMLNTYEIMTQLAPTWEKLNNEQKTLLAQSIAG